MPKKEKKQNPEKPSHLKTNGNADQRPAKAVAVVRVTDYGPDAQILKAFKRLDKVLHLDRFNSQHRELLHNALQGLVLEHLNLAQFDSIFLIIHKILRPKDLITQNLLLMIDDLKIFKNAWLSHYCVLIKESTLLHTQKGLLQVAKTFELIMDFFRFLMDNRAVFESTIEAEVLQLNSKVMVKEKVASLAQVNIMDRHSLDFDRLSRLTQKVEQFLLDLKKSRQRLLNQLYDKISGEHLSICGARDRIMGGGITHASERSDEPNSDNFRNINVYPCSADFFDGGPSNLPVNKITGAYADLNNYLDTQFRLFREDYYSAIRKGIEERANPTSKKNRFLRFGAGRVSSFIGTRHMAGINLSIYVRKQARIFALKKRFMHGSMILMIDHLDKSSVKFLVCIVKNTDENDFKLTRPHGYVNVQVEVVKTSHSLYLSDVDLFGRCFELIEIKAFFDPYFQILKRLQQIKSLSLNSLIVSADKKKNNVPAYLRDSAKVGSSDDASLSSLVRSIVSKWVNDPKLTLDDSQKKVIQNVFATQVSLVQGPPGTGKTYIGVILVKILLELKRHGLFRGPIFLLCYTNHALDQFLLSTLEATTKVTRLGGWTRSDILKQYELNQRTEAKKLKKPLSICRLLDQRNQLEKEFNNLKYDYEEKQQMPFVYSTYILHDAREVEFVSQILNHYKTRLQDFLKYRLPYFGIDGSYFEAYMKNRFGKTPLEGQAVLYWLQLFDFEDIAYEFYYVIMESWYGQDQSIENHGDFEEDFYWPPDKEIANFLKNQPHVNFMMSPPFKAEFSKFKDYYEIFQVCENKYRVDESLTAVAYNKALNSQDQTIFNNPFKLDIGERWSLNNRLVGEKRIPLNKMQDLIAKMQEARDRLQELHHDFDRIVVEDEDIIGMTTTFAAKNKQMLSQIQSKVVIVEEAAKILEPHVVASLTPTTEHLILIGDHKQLRPQINSYELAARAKHDVSLFERLMENHFSHARLMTQRRMRSEISSIARIIYPKLIDHEVAIKRPPIPGFEKNVFFFSHDWPEQQDPDSESKMNLKEAKFIVLFAKFLVQKIGVGPSQIVILSLYSSQLGEIRDLFVNKTRNFPKGKKIRVVTVDNYQGEENDVILVSLVRSNAQNVIGFLSNQNRINVALTRARRMLYLFGNAECIKSHEVRDYANPDQESYWLQVINHLEMRQSVGNEIVYKYPNKKRIQYLRNLESFDEKPIAISSTLCNKRLRCGHLCQMKSHSYSISTADPDGHGKFKCQKECNNLTIGNKNPQSGDLGQMKGHSYPASKADPHGHGNLKGEKIDTSQKICNKRLRCRHICKMPSHSYYTSEEDPDGHGNLKCEQLCNKHPCGHSCGAKCPGCKKPSKFICKTLVSYLNPRCSHKGVFECQKLEKDPSSLVCRKKCGKQVPGGKRCVRFCYEPCSAEAP